MRPFAWHPAATLDDAVKAAAAGGARFIAGGTTLLDLMKLDVMRPEMLVDISGLTEARHRSIEANADGLRLGALARMADAAEHPIVRRDYPMIAESLLLAASPQLRNMASLGGNLLQRTRCGYFRDTSWAACNKRDPGSGCAALEGFNRMHAILGSSDVCIATYAGDFAQSLIALDASLELLGPNGPRRLPFSELHRLPRDRPDIETTLAAGELISAILVPAAAWSRRSLYLKVRDRASYAFALASAAVALDMNGDVVREARIALGGVATVPWRSREAEAAVRGRPLNEDTAAAAAQAAFAGARARAHNAYKLPLGRRTLVRALLAAARMKV